MHCRDLVTQRLAATGGHEHKGVPAGDQLFNDLVLVMAEFGVAEDPLQGIVNGGADDGS